MSADARIGAEPRRDRAVRFDAALLGAPVTVHGGAGTTRVAERAPASQPVAASAPEV
jgi:hypothetical protein